MSDKKKLGRPTTDPKQTRYSVRVNAAQDAIIKQYSAAHSITPVQAIRDGIDKLKDPAI